MQKRVERERERERNFKFKTFSIMMLRKIFMTNQQCFSQEHLRLLSTSRTKRINESIKMSKQFTKVNLRRKRLFILH